MSVKNVTIYLYKELLDALFVAETFSVGLVQKGHISDTSLSCNHLYYIVARKMANKHNNIFFTGTIFVISTILSRTEGMDSFSNIHNFVNN